MAETTIETKRIHVCTEKCKHHWFLGLAPMGLNETYDEETGKCAHSDQAINSSPHIQSYLSDKAEFAMQNPEEVVIERDCVSVIFSYPLRDSHEFELKAQDGEITREMLVDFICETYKKIYQDEAASLVKPASTIDERMERGGLLNREETDGTYGIWGHDIGDLFLEGMTYSAATGKVTLSIGS